MRSTMLLLLISLQFATQAHAVKRVSVEQLSGEMGSFGKQSDAKAAAKLYDEQLTERLSSTRLTAFEAALPGPESRRALVALADQAEFLDPPPAEIPNEPTPGVADQRAMIARSIEYVGAMLKRLPNLLATRNTIRFEDVPPGLKDQRTDTIVPYQPLHPVSRATETVVYQDGKELVQQQAAQQGGANPKATGPVADGLVTSGEFGSIFPMVYGDLPKGNLRWSHWEQAETGVDGVFRFDVPNAASHYRVEYCCFSGLRAQEFRAYHGELTLDPADGTILRITLIADPEEGAQIAEAELMVEYGPVVLGGTKYFCPVRSISISRAPHEIKHVDFPDQRIMGVAQSNPRPEAGEDVPLQTMLSEATFDDYHLFRSEAKILMATSAENGSSPEAPSGTSTGSPNSPSTTPTPQPNGPAAPSAQSAPSNATAVAKPETPSAVEAKPAAVSSRPEIAVAAPETLPNAPEALQGDSGKSSFSLSVSTHLVDVDVSAFDVRGKPLTRLTTNDFEIYDNGRKQTLRSVTRVSGAATAGAQEQAAALQGTLYSNRSEGLSSAVVRPEGAQALTSSTILLLDESSIGFDDLNYARQQLLKFLDRLPASQPAGLYLRIGPSFQILAEQTTDHAALSSVLRKWVPNAQDLARAQEEETRNRQHFDTVDSSSEMQSVSGNMDGMSTPTAGPLSTGMNHDGNLTPDPKLSKEGQTPERDALAALIGVAANMNAIPGHKNLVWVASDNVLANWTDQAGGNERGANTVDAFVLGIEEALNDAHVSLYPLDASQLQASAKDASLEFNSVGLDPAVTTEGPTAGDGASVNGGREQAEMQQNARAIRPDIQHLARATGGRSFGRSGNLMGELDSVIAGGDGTYLLSFSPDTQPDGKYHQITVTAPAQSGIKLRYRTGYLYSKEPSTLKERLTQAVWQPQDESEIGLSAHWDRASQGAAISLSIAGSDVGLVQKGDLWTDRLDIFLVQRDDTGTRAQTKVQSLALNLKPETYQKVLRDGIPFAEYVEHKQTVGTTRIIVVDQNTGRLGSVTLPVMLDRASQ